MKYVLGEQSARFLRELMAKERGYKPAQPLRPREVKRDFAGGVSTPVYPLMVRFVPSVDQDAGAGEGDFIIYVPDGSVVVNGVALRSADIPLDPYATGAYANNPDWYALPQMADGDSVLLGISYDSGDDAMPLLVDFHVGEPADVESEDGVVARDIILANVSISQATQGGAVRVRVHQVVKGPLIQDFGVETLNGALGKLKVVGGKDGMVLVEGQRYWVNVDREEGSSEIKVSLSDVPPDEDPDDEADGYCNDISDESGEELGNEISDDSGFDDGGGGVAPGNEISKTPCNTEEQ